MKKKQCSFEARVLGELLQGRPGKEIRNHIGKCPVCQDSVLVHSGMERLQAGINHGAVKPGIPDFESLWIKARTFQAPNRELEKRALLPLLVPRIILYVMIATAAVFLLMAKSANIKAFFYTDTTIGVLYNILLLMGKKLLVLLPFMMIPLGFLLFFAVGHFLYSLFHSMGNSGDAH